MYKLILYFSLVLLYDGLGICPETYDFGLLKLHSKDIGFFLFLALRIGDKKVLYINNRYYHLLLYVIILSIYEFISTGYIGILVAQREWIYSLFVFGVLSQLMYRTREGIFKFLIWVTLIHAIFYIFQSTLHVFDMKYVLSENGRRRYLCSPYFLFLTHIVVLERMKGLKRFAVLVSLLCCSYLTGSDAAILISITSLLMSRLYVLNRLQGAIKLLLVGVIIILFIPNMSFLNSFKGILDISVNNLVDYYHGDTFSFRLAIVYERLVFLITKGYLWFGYTLYPDMLFQTKLFVLGTHNESYPFGIEQLQSADIMWPGLLMRLGLLGVFLYVRCFASFFGKDLISDIGLGLILVLTSMNSGMMNNALILSLYFSLINTTRAT